MADRIINKAQLKVIVIEDNPEIVEAVPLHGDKDSLLRRQSII